MGGQDQASPYATKRLTERVEDKAALRRGLAEDVSWFLAAGNKITKVPAGLSGAEYSKRARRDTFVINPRKAAQRRG
ncbi:MAG: hypothetical protein F4213_12130 [Boseongicola sp. SB0677_bin_26]|nr:hypothetical protein [Boseongicola sp. SB0677_bin_26]